MLRFRYSREHLTASRSALACAALMGLSVIVSASASTQGAALPTPAPNTKPVLSQPLPAKPTLAVSFIDAASSRLSFDWPAIERGEATVLISSPNDLEDQLHVTLEEPSSSEAAPKPGLAITPTELKLTAHGLGKLHLAADVHSEATTSHPYDAVLKVTSAYGAVASVNLRIAPAQLHPGIGKISFLSMSPLISTWTVPIDVPLMNDQIPAKLPAIDSAIGFLRSDNGNYLTVRFLGVDRASRRSAEPEPTHTGASVASGNSQARDASAVLPPLIAHLQIESMHQGHFDGNVSLSDASANKEPITVVLDGQHHVIYALLTIILGIAAAAASKIYLMTYRILWLLKAQVRALPKLFDSVQGHFKHLAPNAKYNPRADLESQRQALLTTLSTFQSWQRKIADNRSFFDDRLKELKAIQTQTSDWGLLGDDLHALNAEIHNVKKAGHKPRCMLDAQDIYRGGTILGAELVIARQKAQSQLELLDSWLKVWQYWMDVKEEVHKSGNDSDRSAIDAIEPDLLAAVGIDDLTTLKGTIYRVWARMGKNISLGIIDSYTAPRSIAAPALGMPIPDALRKAAPDPGRHWQILVRYGDAASFILGATLAILTALNTFYFGKAFGSFYNYLALFLAAASTKAGVDVVTALLDRFAGVATARSA